MLNRIVPVSVTLTAAGLAEPPAAADGNPWLDYEMEAWVSVLVARKSGPHRGTAAEWKPLREQAAAVFNSVPAADWVVLVVVMYLMFFMDMTVLHQLPETGRTHVVQLVFWVLVALAIDAQVWLRLGPQAGICWVTGYIMEIVYSIDGVFVTHLVLSSMETPRRLTNKALYLSLIGSIILRFAYALGLAPFMNSLRVLPYAIGAWLLYWGSVRLTTTEEDDVDVLQTPAVRAARGLLGSRLGSFYDEEGEGFVAVSGGKHCATLLSVVMLCLFSADLVMGVDVALAKAELIPNAFINFSSSTLALFALRALFFVARDIFHRFSFTSYGTGLVLLLLGVESLIGGVVYVSAMMSCAAVILITALAVGVSAFCEPWQKISV